MGIDRTESSRRGQSSRRSKKHTDNPQAKRFVQIKTVVMQSAAWQSCNYSVRCVFLELSGCLRWVSGQSEPVNNGHLWLSRSQWEEAGFASATVTRAIKHLIKVGLVFRTRTGGIGRDCSEYALTCFPLTEDTDNLFCKGFVKDAWSKYVPDEKKSQASKVNQHRFKNDSLPIENSDKEIKFEQQAQIKCEHQESKSTNLLQREAAEVLGGIVPAPPGVRGGGMEAQCFCGLGCNRFPSAGPSAYFALKGYWDMEQFFDVAFSRTDDGAVRLEQIDYAGESSVILLHPAQLKYIAFQLCGFREETAERVEDLQRRISILSDRLESLTTDKWFRETVLEGDDGCEALIKLDGLTDLAIEFDGGRLMAEGREAGRARRYGVCTGLWCSRQGGCRAKKHRTIGHYALWQPLLCAAFLTCSNGRVPNGC